MLRSSIGYGIALAAATDAATLPPEAARENEMARRVGESRIPYILIVTSSPRSRFFVFPTRLQSVGGPPPAKGYITPCKNNGSEPANCGHTTQAIAIVTLPILVPGMLECHGKYQYHTAT